jgi:hypothetical protein
MNRTFLNVCRTIHIYLTLVALAVMLLFGVTGFTINHEDWFGATTPRVRDEEGTTPAELMAKNDRLMIVEHLRKTFKITGAITTPIDDGEDRMSISFDRPAERWTVEIQKPSGATSVHHEMFNWVAVINDLHRGRASGLAWRWVIDISAILIVLACATGVVLWLALPKRRKLGIAFLIVGTVLTYGVYHFLVPGADEKVERAEAQQQP